MRTNEIMSILLDRKKALWALYMDTGSKEYGHRLREIEDTIETISKAMTRELKDEYKGNTAKLQVDQG